MRRPPMDLRERTDDSPQPVRRRRREEEVRAEVIIPRALHPDLVALIRIAWETGRTRAFYVGAIYWSTEDGRVYHPPVTQLKRLRRLAVMLNYFGHIFDEVGS